MARWKAQSIPPLQAGCTLRGDIEAPRLMVDENATFVGSAKVGTANFLPA
jgi:hypothetical protein